MVVDNKDHHQGIVMDKKHIYIIYISSVYVYGKFSHLCVLREIYCQFYKKYKKVKKNINMNPTSIVFNERTWKDRNLLNACRVLVCRRALRALLLFVKIEYYSHEIER